MKNMILKSLLLSVAVSGVICADIADQVEQLLQAGQYEEAHVILNENIARTTGSLRARLEQQRETASQGWGIIRDSKDLGEINRARPNQVIRRNGKKLDKGKLEDQINEYSQKLRAKGYPVPGE